MSDTNKESAQASQSDSGQNSVDMSNVTLGNMHNVVSQKQDALTDPGKNESSNAEETVDSNDQVSEDITSNEEASQSEETINDEAQVSDQDQEKDDEVQKDSNIEQRFAKLEKSYKGLEAEFTRRSQSLKSKDEEIQKLRDELQSLKGQTQEGEESQLIEEVRAKNPDAAKLLDALMKEQEAKLRKHYDEQLKKLQADKEKSIADENIKQFDVKIQEFLKSPYATLEQEFLEVVNEFYPSSDELATAAATDPQLYDKLFDRFVIKHRRKVVQAEIDSQNVKQKDPANSSKREQEIAKSKGAGKAKTSEPKADANDWSDLSDINKFKKAPKKEQDAWLRKVGLGGNHPLSNFSVKQ